MADKEDLVQDGPRPRKGRFQERSNEAAPEAAAEGWVASATMLEGGVVIAEPVDDEAAGDDQQLCVVESIEVIDPAADGGQQTTKMPHQQHNAFTPEEDDAIRKGVLKYGAGKWKEILADRELAVLKLKGRNSDAVRLRWSRTIAPEDAQESGAPQTLPEAGVRREADVQGKPGLQLWRSDKNVTGYVGVTLKDKKSAELYSAKGPIINGEGQYLGQFRTALEAATAFAQHVQGMGDEWLQSRQVQHAWLEQHPGAEEGIKKGQDSKTARRAEREPVQSGGREGVGHGGSTPTVRLLQSKSGADEYKGVLPTVTRAAGLDLHLSAKTNTGYEGVSMKKQSRNEHGNRQIGRASCRERV